MSKRLKRLRVLSKKLDSLLDRGENLRFPRDPDKTVDENVPVSPHGFPGILTDTMGGPGSARHREHQAPGPRGIASSEEEEEEEKDD